MVFHSSRVLITGGDGFTGVHLTSHLVALGVDVYHLKSDLLDRNAIFEELRDLKVDYVIHLAAISFAAEGNISKIYQVNVEGSVNLLDALVASKFSPLKVVLASSAAVYGNQINTQLSEDLCPSPVNHYGCSKLAMEHMSQNYLKLFPVLVVRPFNYTGLGHGIEFLVSKIVAAYKQKKSKIELGNLDVYREFNDVRDICSIYESLLTSNAKDGVFNICSGKTVSLMEIISYMDDLAGYKMKVNINPEFVRKNEIKVLSGDCKKLQSLVNYQFKFNIHDTLEWVYRSQANGQ